MESKIKKIHLFLIVAIFCGIGLAFGLYAALWRSKVEVKVTCLSTECQSAAVNLQQSMDFKVKPCDDFYKYACGSWPRNFPVLNNKLDGTSGTVYLRQSKNYREILSFLKESNGAEPEAVHKARRLFSLCMNDAAFKDSNRVYDIMSQIGVPAVAMGTDENKDFDYVTAMAKVTRIAGIKMFFDLAVMPDPVNRLVNAIWLWKPLRDAYLHEEMSTVVNGRFKREMNPSEDFISSVKSKICPKGSNSPLCAKWNDQLNKVIYDNYLERLEIIYKARSNFGSSKLFPSYTIEQLQTLTDDVAKEVKSSIPKLDWSKYIKEMFSNLEDVSLDFNNPLKIQVIVVEPSFLRDMIKFILTRSIKEIELAFWGELVYKVLPTTDANLFEKKLAMQSSSREENCLVTVTSLFEPAISYLHVKKRQYSEMKAEVEEIFKNIKSSFEKTLKEVSWMDEATREKSLKKLASVKAHTPYPGIVDSPGKLDELYKDVDVKDNFFDVLNKKARNKIKKNLNSLNKMNNLDDVDWTLPSNTANAFYSLNYNTIYLPFGILGKPIYFRGLKALDYGTIGQVLGHELTHGFDNTGREFDDIGNLKHWWDEKTSKTFEEKAHCFINVYDQYFTTFNGIYQKVSSKISINEDIADNGAFHHALSAYRKFVSEKGEEMQYLMHFEEFTHEQILTLGYANFWCERITLKDSSTLSSTEIHSPKPVRVNGVFKNSEEFAKIWNCPKGSNMNPVDKCKIW